MTQAKYNPSFTENKTLNAVTTGTGTAVPFSDCRQVSWATTTSGTITGGTIIIETAPAADYAGTWFLLDTISATGANTGAEGTGTFPGPLEFVRGRISSNITGGGTITVTLNGLKG